MTRTLRGLGPIAAPFLAGAALLGGAVPASASTTAASSAATIRPMTADNCGTNGDSGTYNCMYVAGSGLYASEVRGWSKYDGFGHPVHEEVTGPDGVVCNSNTVTTGDPNTVVGCQVYPKKDIAGGTYCSILWEYMGGGYYSNDAENCVSVFS